jgi:hypothetical protein
MTSTQQREVWAVLGRGGQTGVACRLDRLPHSAYKNNHQTDHAYHKLSQMSLKIHK